MVGPSSAQGTRPYAPPARQVVCKLVTSDVPTAPDISFIFNAPVPIVPVGVPLFSHGKRSLSLFSSYHYQTLSLATRGGTPHPYGA